MIEKMLGRVVKQAGEEGDDIVFRFTDGSVGRFTHHQDCCEDVHIDDVNGDWNDLIGHPLLQADENTDTEEDVNYNDGSVTWTFYTFRSIGGCVDVTWRGSSNGYYSESVDFEWEEQINLEDYM